MMNLVLGLAVSDINELEKISKVGKFNDLAADWQRAMGQFAVYYTSPQSFMIPFSYSLAKNFRDFWLVSSFD